MVSVILYSSEHALVPFNVSYNSATAALLSKHILPLFLGCSPLQNRRLCYCRAFAAVSPSSAAGKLIMAGISSLHVSPSSCRSRSSLFRLPILYHRCTFEVSALGHPDILNAKRSLFAASRNDLTVEGSQAPQALCRLQLLPYHPREYPMQRLWVQVQLISEARLQLVTMLLPLAPRLPLMLGLLQQWPNLQLLLLLNQR